MLDLGHGHHLRWVSWKSDRALNPQYADLPDVERYGAMIAHPRAASAEWASGECEGKVTFAGPVQQRIQPAVATWTVVSWEPLTLSPSLRCGCGDHGFIRDGRWVPA